MYELLKAMAHSPVRNYAIPGLTSWLIGQPSDLGRIRLFECERDHVEPITPHSHRFDFECLVLKGQVVNRVWSRSYDGTGDLYQATELRYGGQPGEYTGVSGETERWVYEDELFRKDSTYGMKAEQVHSIYFKKGTAVLFVEGPQVSTQSIILQPVVDGKVVLTFKVEDWMFRRG